MSCHLKKICAIVVTYNRKALLKTCLNALLNQNIPELDVYVFDNNSNDGTVSFLKQLTEVDPRVIFKSSRVNREGLLGFILV
ncbi:glycosyltransferase [Desulfobaculum bizertense]|uniref:glycosyltransferase n=1 Tax=Desulfobaculum bizertense TaxID=376490 RepID=UPI003D75E490